MCERLMSSLKTPCFAKHIVWNCKSITKILQKLIQVVLNKYIPTEIDIVWTFKRYITLNFSMFGNSFGVKDSRIACFQ